MVLCYMSKLKENQQEPEFIKKNNKKTTIFFKKSVREKETKMGCCVQMVWHTIWNLHSVCGIMLCSNAIMYNSNKT